MHFLRLRPHSIYSQSLASVTIQFYRKKSDSSYNKFKVSSNQNLYLFFFVLLLGTLQMYFLRNSADFPPLLTFFLPRLPVSICHLGYLKLQNATGGALCFPMISCMTKKKNPLPGIRSVHQNRELCRKQQISTRINNSEK